VVVELVVVVVGQPPGRQTPLQQTSEGVKQGRGAPGGQQAPPTCPHERHVPFTHMFGTLHVPPAQHSSPLSPHGATQLGPLPGGGPPVGQESQQLEQPVLASPPTVPPASVQRIASLFALHFGTDVVCGMQHVTKPAFPHTECAAHLTTALLQSFGRKFGSDGSRLERVLATPLTHFAY